MVEKIPYNLTSFVIDGSIDKTDCVDRLPVEIFASCAITVNSSKKQVQH